MVFRVARTVYMHGGVVSTHYRLHDWVMMIWLSVWHYDGQKRDIVTVGNLFSVSVSKTLSILNTSIDRFHSGLSLPAPLGCIR